MADVEHNHLMLFFESPCGRYQFRFDDDGKVAYGYLLENDSIIGDVWLYNRCSTPDKPEWKDKANIPFANCLPYAREEDRVQTEITAEDLKRGLVAHWNFDEGAGQTLKDTSGHGHDGAIVGSSWSNGCVRGGLSFDGRDDRV